MAPAEGTIPPPISWAQRNDLLYVIIDVECKDIDYKVTENSFTFTGTNALDANKKYEVTLHFLKPVNPDTVISKNIGRCIEYTIYKKESGPFWKSLTNDKTKLHFLKANFTKWRNESDDDEDNIGNNISFPDFLSGQDNRFDDFNVDDDDDSDDNIPSLSQNDDDEDDKKDDEKKDQEK